MNTFRKYWENKHVLVLHIYFRSTGTKCDKKLRKKIVITCSYAHMLPGIKLPQTNKTKHSTHWYNW